MLYRINWKGYYGSIGTDIFRTYDEGIKAAFKKISEGDIAYVELRECLKTDSGREISAIVWKKWKSELL